MLQIRDVFLVKRRAAVEEEVMLIVPVRRLANLVETCYLFGKNNCARKQRTLKASSSGSSISSSSSSQGRS